MFTAGMEFDLGEDVNALRDMVHRWAQERVKPLAAQTDRDNAFPNELWPELGEMGLLGITVALSVQIVGSLLVLALLITPAAAAMNLTVSPVRTVVLSVVFAELAMVGGILLALGGNIPISPYVTTISFVLWLVWAWAERGLFGLVLIVLIVAAYLSLVAGRHGRWLPLEVRAWALAYPLYLLAVVRPITSMWRFLLLDFPIAALLASVAMRTSTGGKIVAHWRRRLLPLLWLASVFAVCNALHTGNKAVKVSRNADSFARQIRAQ